MPFICACFFRLLFFAIILPFSVLNSCFVCVCCIHAEIKPFAHALRIHCAAVYGGASIADQIGELKRGAEAVVATPGRLIDMLCANNGKVMNLQRVSYLVLDEADRMFDMGFEPQINVVLNHTRPDRQSIMFSATFPPSIEKLARRTLRHKPLELVVGGRSVVSSLVHQVIEVHPSAAAAPTRFLRLLQLLGEFADVGQALVFVDSQQTCDALFMQLLEVGYHAIVLHGAMDQARPGAGLAI
jgi:ATP-dependent RNA helicase DDX46/PRP5